MVRSGITHLHQELSQLIENIIIRLKRTQAGSRAVDPLLAASMLPMILHAKLGYSLSKWRKQSDTVPKIIHHCSTEQIWEKSVLLDAFRVSEQVIL